MIKRLILFLTCLFLTAGMALAQTRVGGVVVALPDNEPVVGASVKVVGTGTGTITDIDGKFSLSVPANAQLEFSYIGMKSKVLTAKANMRVELESVDNTIDEVMVVAFGTQKKSAFTGSAAVVSSKDLAKRVSTNVSSTLAGTVAGFQMREASGEPGAGNGKMNIRGISSLEASTDPLIIVDGAPYPGSLSNIPQQDIESVTVLKDAASAALYGARGASGVILITTKRGSKESTKPVITFTTDLSAQTLSRKFERQDVYAQGTTLSKYNPNASMTWGPKIADLPNDATYGGNKNNAYTNGDLTSHAGMYYNPKYAAAGLSGWTTPQTYDNVGDFFKTGFTQNSTFNISQRKNDVSYSFSLSDTYQKGIIPSTGMTRTGAHGAVDWKVNEQWKTGFSTNYSSVKITSAPGANSGIVNVVYSAPSEYNLKGTPYHKPGDPTSQVLFRATSFNNPYWWAANDEYSQHTNRLFGNAYA